MACYSYETLRQRMTTPHDEEQLREIADRHGSQDPAFTAQLYEYADYVAQLRKARGDVNDKHETGDDA